MTAIGQAYKASQLQAMLNRHFKSTEGVTARTTATAKGITIGIYFEGGDEYQERFPNNRQTTFLAADKRTPHELFTDAIGPADHWVDIQWQIDQDARAGKL